jgi:hypothetical protein
MTTQQTIPRDWPNRIRLAIQAARTPADREKVVAEALVMLRRGDPMDLRAQGLDAEKRDAIYTAQIRRQERRSAA